MTQTNTFCDLGDLPIWYGAQSTPEIKTAPFAFEVDEVGLVRLRRSSVTEEMIDGYGKDGYHFITSPPGASNWGNALAKKSLDGLASLHGSLTGLNVLEVGGGTLYSAEQMVGAMGASSVTLVDPAVATQSVDPRVTVRRQYFGVETDLPHTFKLIVSLNTLEHVPDPVQFLRGIRHWLADDGVAYLKMPECGESLAIGDLGLCVHEHLSYFSPDSLDATLGLAGLRRVAEANYKGALQVLVRRAEVNPNARCAGTTEILASFAQKATSHVARIRRFAEENRGGKVAFVGASVGLSNLLFLSGITDLMDVEIFDGDELKAGRYLPGIKTPIRVTADAALGKHQHIFITPVNFFSDIRDQLRLRPELGRADIRAVFLA